MRPGQLLETGLRVLTAWTEGRQPASADVRTLRIALPTPYHLPLDELASRIVDQARQELRASAQARDEAQQQTDQKLINS